MGAQNSYETEGSLIHQKVYRFQGSAALTGEGTDERDKYDEDTEIGAKGDKRDYELRQGKKDEVRETVSGEGETKS